MIFDTDSQDITCYATAGFADRDSSPRCYRCLVQTPRAWCRSSNCSCPYNIQRLLAKIFERGLLLDTVPGGRERADSRAKVFRDIIASLPSTWSFITADAAGKRACLQVLTKQTLVSHIRALGAHTSTLMRKDDLIDLLLIRLHDEVEFNHALEGGYITTE